MTLEQSHAQTLARKRLEGVKANKDLKLLVEEALQLGVTAVEEDKENNNGRPKNVHEPLPTVQAVALLERFTKNNDLKKAKVIPISVIRSLDALFQTDAVRKDRLSKALQQPSQQLCFSSPCDSAKKDLTPEQLKFQKRMERLRLQQEETKYSKLTANVGVKTRATDDITTKSMTYAASIGLNMIIAPISFGCFMYFFAGSILEFFWKTSSDTEIHANTPDIKKVIMGVVSGVAMLFIEMILFVIRTHEMDEAARKKSKKSKQGPFGYYTADTTKSFVGK